MTGNLGVTGRDQRRGTEHMCHTILKIKCFEVSYSEHELTTALAICVYAGRVDHNLSSAEGFWGFLL